MTEWTPCAKDAKGWEDATVPDDACSKYLRSVGFDPLPKQYDFITCPADDVGFGGARGGAKSAAIVGDWLWHEKQYGANAIGIVFRRERTQLVEFIEFARKFLEPVGFKWKALDKTLLGPEGSRLRFEYLDRDQDADIYQGSSFCVAVGTRIRMADGTLKPIQEISVGEAVSTLSGPRRVTYVTAPYRAPCVEAVVRDNAGYEVGRQIHPTWHPVLTTDGLISSRSVPDNQTDAQRPFDLLFGDKLDQEFPSCAYQARRGWYAFSEGGQTYCKSSREIPAGSARPQPLTVPVVLHEPSVRLSASRSRAGRTVPNLFHAVCRSFAQWTGLRPVHQWQSSGLSRLRELLRQVLDFANLCLPSAFANGRLATQSLGSLGGCRDERGFCGELVRFSPENGPSRIPSPADAGELPHTSPLGASGTILEHTPQHSWWWVHPYTGEARHLSEAVTTGTMHLRPIGSSLVMDLSIEDANHYITETGLVNKNTRLYMEERGTFPREQTINKLHATLRSGTGVPCQAKSTFNPGGVGHQHCRERYRLFERIPRGYDIFKTPNGGTRVFIPSRLRDNKHLGENYVRQLREACAGNEALLNAWLDGDWSIVEGAFFENWRSDHVIDEFDIPRDWPRFRSFRWGSAKPFSVGWWAVASDDRIGSDTPGAVGPFIQKGSLVRYREWYGAKPGQTDTGLKMQAEEIARGILERTPKGEPIGYTVASPSTFQTQRGPSISERMRAAGVGLIPADDFMSRDVGHATGWDQLRARLVGNDKGPAIFCFKSCADSVRTIPALQHDRDHPEDVDDESETQAASEWRFAVMSRPWSPVKVEPPKPRQIIIGGETTLTLDDLWKAHEGRNSSRF